MISYCVKQKKQPECVPGSERVVKAENGRSMMKCTCAECGITKTKFVKQAGNGLARRKDLDGGSLDIHKLIGKIPRPKAGWTPGKYKYMGAYNPLDKQLEYDKNTGEVTKWHVQPYNEVDRISAHHDICYDMGKNKNECDKVMVKSLDKIPYGQMPKWGQTARFLINTKQKLGLGVKQKKPKNGKRR